jgi:hypothetical protein
MKLEHQVCALEQAKRLRKLGVRAKSYFVWIHGWPINKTARKGWRLIARDDTALYSITRQVNAYSCAELGAILPETIIYRRYVLDYQINKNDGFFWPSYQGEIRPNLFDEIGDEYEAQAKANLFILLLEKGFIKPEDIKL